MGFSTLVTNVIMFVAVISLTTAFVAIFKTYVDESTSSISIQSKVISNNLKIDLNIVTISYDNNTEKITSHIQNTGKTKLDLDYVDVYIDDIFVPRVTSNRTINVLNSTEIENPGIWDPKEVIEINVYMNLSKGTHKIAVSTEYGVKDSTTFSN